MGKMIDEAFDLTGRIAVITGAARGIGKAGAMVLGDAGAHVVVADVLDDAARETVEELTAVGLQL